jgi:pimeloyl-ACP methyl ester carboxylesterase
MDIILIPGLWLDGSAWDEVVPLLEQAGHRAHAITLPGMESKDADRSKVTMRDWIDAVTQVIDTADPAGGQVALVGHSLGSAIASVALDARADRVARVFYVGGFPTGGGKALAAGFEVRDDEIPFPDWSEFDDADIADLDDAARARFRDRAIPAPAFLAREAVHLSDDRRYDVPATAVCPEYSPETLRQWIADGQAGVREFPKIRDLDYADIDSGHWPMFTRPADLATIILERVSR